MSRLARAVACIALLAAAAVHAQITTSRVDVRITGARCGELQNVFLVMDDDDRQEKWIRLEPEEACRWSVDLGSSGRFSTALSHFSLRVDFARTDCRRAAANTQDLVAELEFACCNEEQLRNLRVRTTPPMRVSYLRAVPAVTPKSVKCVEMGILPKSGGAILLAQFGAEDVYLQIGANEPRRKELGLLIDDVASDEGVLVLSRDGVAWRLAVQRAKGKDRNAPAFSPNALSIDIKKLGDLKLERAEIEVIK